MFDSLTDEVILSDDFLPMFASDSIIVNLRDQVEKHIVDTHTHEL